ncbi:MAG: hypothetical protein M0Q98_13410 [Pseudomonas sp.]|jgi:hypothetical protein|nr:hypothetical protein [Pseudomonas sp.]
MKTTVWAGSGLIIINQFGSREGQVMRYDGIGMGGPFGALVMFGLATFMLFVLAAWIHSKKPKESEATSEFIVNVGVKAIYLAIVIIFSLVIALVPAKLFDLQGWSFLAAGAIVFVCVLIWEAKKGR